MNGRERMLLGAVRWILPVVLIACAGVPAMAQTSPQQPSSPATIPSTQAAPPQNTAPPDTSKPLQDQNPYADDIKITPEEANELFHSIDQILEFDSHETGLPIKHEVKRRLVNRDEVVSYLTKHVDDEDTKRLRRSELVLKKFGLLPRDFNLQTFLVALLREEVAGYYDPKTKTVNLLDWVPMEEQEPVIAHELTHALQDQTINMQRWMKKGDKDLAEIHHDPSPQEIEDDEIDNAREAVLEGQAQAMMFQFAIAPAHHSIIDSPELVQAMEEETMTGSPATKVFNEAPIFMKESMEFPYSYGMDFVIQLWRSGGKQKAYAQLLQNPPHTTRQIMQPETYLAGETMEPLPVPQFKRDFPGYQKFDIGAMGELDVAMLIEQYAGKEVSKKMYPEWRGGYYYAVKSKTDIAAPLGLYYISRWSSDTSAEEFAAIYAASLKQRYKKAEEQGAAADPLVTTGSKSNALATLKGRHTWATDEGNAVIEQQGQMVLISESLDAATTAGLEKEVFRAAPAPAAP